jgi:hypothetical protein
MIHKIKAHKDKLKEPKVMIIIGLSLLILAFLSWALLETEEFQIEDKCGKFVNLASHTIEDETKCRTRCLGQCQSQDMDYVKVRFEEVPGSCNICTCHCR